ncbi:hypothetical protein PAL_GLEAN10005629 [Pteropus alecto]|uniref:Uncharacterized protein n=1 Tax=Pteropus alecto TaxID=9402 RepID=L5KVI8_PTEAL|nr:hypothetical protein PAL_GLEAN10005629 [Pteropus alecto]
MHLAGPPLLQEQSQLILFRQLRALRLEHHGTLPVLLGPLGSKKWLAISCTQGLCKQRRNCLQSWAFKFVEAQKASGPS